MALLNLGKDECGGTPSEHLIVNSWDSHQKVSPSPAASVKAIDGGAEQRPCEAVAGDV